jgi:non-specific serine/threonine protein kinase
VPPPSTPRALCGERTQFSLYRCMQQLCTTARWRAHPECARLRATDLVD